MAVSGDDYTITQTMNVHNLYLSPGNSSLSEEFTCTATNRLGSDSKTITVSPVVGPVNFTSDPAGAQLEEYTIDWVVDSGENITAFTLEFRELDADQWIKVGKTFQFKSSKHEF